VGGPLRVLHVVVNMNRGGAETLIMNLYRNINPAKIQFDFLTCKEGDFDSEINERGGLVYRIPYISDVGHLCYIKELKTFFETNKQYRIVHCHMDRMSGLVLRAAKQAGISVRISHSHNTKSEGGLAARLYKWYAGQLILPNSTDLLACSNDAANWLFKDKSHSTKIVRNGIEIQSFQFSAEIRKNVRRELKLDKRKFVLGHVGRFNHQKNHSFLLDIFAQVNKEIEDSVLILVGDGDLRLDIERKIKNLHLEDKVYLLGIRSDINRLLQAFDLFLLPSIHEGLPVSLIEAQGAGLPCLIADNISKDVDMGMELVEFSPLTSISLWVEKIKTIQLKQLKRTEIPTSLLKQGYDIQETANHIEDYYLAISR
jgi:glycosyltransferase involved in cell wall biosynthesis